MKKIIYILIGLSIILTGAIFIIYKNNFEVSEEIIDLTVEDDKEEEITKREDETNEIFVDIKGAIVNPGIYKVEADSRVNDIINLAGGLLENADTSKINLAKKVTDEMTIIIYTKEELQNKINSNECICNCEDVKNDACINENNIDDSHESTIVNINTASIDKLLTLPGIGEAKAKEIISYRDGNGLFENISDIKNVPGIGAALFEKIKAYITV